MSRPPLYVCWLLAVLGSCDDGTCPESCPRSQQCVAGACRLPCVGPADCAARQICFDGFCETGDLPPGSDGAAAGGDGATQGDNVMAVCGDGNVGPGELCDGANLDGMTACTDFAYGSGGAVACMPGCTAFNLSTCIDLPGGACGNGVANQREQCDQSDVNDESCQSLGFASGMLGCTSHCAFDVSACVAR